VNIPEIHPKHRVEKDTQAREEQRKEGFNVGDLGMKTRPKMA
jgi:hypothetical protein